MSNTLMQRPRTRAPCTITKKPLGSFGNSTEKNGVLYSCDLLTKPAGCGHSLSSRIGRDWKGILGQVCLEVTRERNAGTILATLMRGEWITESEKEIVENNTGRPLDSLIKLVMNRLSSGLVRDLVQSQSEHK